jgi:hypothetical protein
MTGEFYFNDTWRPFAGVFFSLGLVALALHYVPLAACKVRASLCERTQHLYALRKDQEGIHETFEHRLLVGQSEEARQTFLGSGASRSLRAQRLRP